jgi:flagellin
VLNTAEGSLSEISSLLLEIQSLTNQAANTGALSPQEVSANQLQVDAILNSVNRISNTTQFNGVKLLNGGLDYTTSGISSAAIDIATINAAKVPDNGVINVAVQVTASAKVGVIAFTTSGIGAVPTTVEIAGNIGTEQLSFAASAHNSAVAVAINQLKESTGVSASVVAGGNLELYSTAFGSREFVSVKTITGTFADGKVFGADAGVTINGSAASVNGKVATVRTGDLDVTLSLDTAFAQNTSPTGVTSFQITGGGAKFQLGERVERQAQVNIGISSVAATKLGNEVVGFLSTLASSGENSLVGGNTIQAQKVLDAAIKQVAEIRGRLGAFQKNVVETNVNSLNVALENVTAAQSQIRDADFAAETAALTRAQILVQANTSVLAQANASPQNVLALLGR